MKKKTVKKKSHAVDRFAPPKQPSKIELAPDKSVCRVGNLHLKKGQSIDFKPATEQKLTMGKILDFKYAGAFDHENTESVWMKIQELEVRGGKSTDWISVSTWAEQLDSGLFENIKTTVEDENIQPADTENLPF